MHHVKKHTGLFTKQEIFFGSLGIILTIVLGFLVIYYSNDLKNLANIKNFGLAGMFLLTFLASSIFSLTPVAMPYWVLTFTLPGILAVFPAQSGI